MRGDNLPIDTKYIVFKRGEFHAVMQQAVLLLASMREHPASLAATLGCGCECHRSDSVKHVAPCCDAPPFVAESVDVEAVLAGVLHIAEAAKVADAVVIRRQDIFAPPALDAYSNSILVAIALADPGDIVDRLRQTADYFHRQAAASWDCDRKIPN